jgi:DNA-3-methyladenine glycosylase
MELKPLPREFYDGSARDVAPLLLGHWLVRRLPEGQTGGLIVEVEAYLEGDEACHAFRGRSARNAAMWGPPGCGYVYLIYGLHHCVNAVCLPSGRAEAVLIRAIEPQLNPELMRRLRPSPGRAGLANGPAKLCQALDIDRRLDAADLCHAGSPLYIASNPGRDQFLAERGPVVATPRIGISVAVDRPLRYLLSNSSFLSRRHRDAAQSGAPRAARD